MKTLIIRTIAVIILISGITFTACKKYEDGPSFSLLTKKSRISGNWKVESVTKDGKDATDLFHALEGDNYTLDIEKDGHYKVNGNDPDDGTWKFGEDKDDVYFQSSKAGSKEESFHILRLKSKELWLKQTQSNGEVDIVKYKQ